MDGYNTTMTPTGNGSRSGEDAGGDYYLIEIEAKLPRGAPDLRRVLSRIHKYDVIPLEEYHKYRLDNRSRSSHDRFSMKLWIRKEDYRPLTIRLGKLDIGDGITVTKFRYL